MGCDEREAEIEMRSQKLANTNPIFYCISFSIKHLCDIFFKNCMHNALTKFKDEIDKNFKLLKNLFLFIPSNLLLNLYHNEYYNQKFSNF